ncbi:conserved hypothetical protein [Hyella patelloides LEGE 07179]|uniref:Uncharacterized protein n=1 Tax=Hyella patelloides LEGE 07179 TaxID=945734 RepID=A0A563VXY2_9CYAN|nr:hypothetical protein [Hyella patelloides]VEP16281.1 conserved hypothetical protein [Hyella patelloides LEGE 07179]
MFNFNNRILVSCLTGIVSFSAIVSLQVESLKQQIKIKNQSTKAYIQQEKHRKAQANIQQKIPSFGYNNLIADWAFLQYIQYFGDTEAREVTGYSVITDYFETIVNKDPKFIDANLILSTTNSIFAGNPQKTVSLLEKSLESITPEMSPYPFFIWGYKAIDEVLLLGDIEAAKKSYQTAASWAEVSNVVGSDVIAKRYLETVAFLETNPDSTTIQISGWTMILSNNSDRQIREYALKKIEELGGIVTVNPNGKISIKAPEKV